MNFHLADNIKKLNGEKKLGIALFALSLVFLIISSYIGLTKANFWFDEYYSMNMVLLPFQDMLVRGANNVHPLLYYLILRAFVKFFGLFNINNIGVVSVFVSLIPFYLMFALAVTKVKKNFGFLTASIFSFTTIAMPLFLRFSIEVRMYGWAMLFLTASYIYMYEINESSDLKKWAILTALTICSAHTHYFAAVASFCMYFLFLIHILYKKRELLKYFIISAVVAVLSYVPWIPSLMVQMHRVNKNFWIDPINFHTIISYVYYIFSPLNSYVDGNAVLNPDIAGTALLLCFVLVFYFYLKSNNKKAGKFPIYGLAVVILVPLIGVVVSIVKSPVFFMRYLFPVLGILWLAFSIFLDNIKDKKRIFTVVLVIILLIGLINMATFIDTENKNYEEQVNSIENVHKIIPEGSIVIYTDFASYIASPIYDNNYTIIFLDNLAHHNKPKEFWKDNPNGYLSECLNQDAIKNKPDNVEVFICDKCDKFSDITYNVTLISENRHDYYKLNI